jgi:signal transduction histidine kinase/ActR/RegA family two-component response regulator
MQAAARRRRIRYVSLAFGGLVAALLAVGAVVWVNIARIEQAVSDVAEAQAELAWADAVLDAASDQQNALAGIVATHDPRYLTPYKQGQVRFEHALERLTAFSLDDAANQRRDVASATQLARTWTLGVAQPQVAAIEAGRVLAPPPRAALEEIDQVQDPIRDLRDGQTRLLAGREHRLAGAFLATRMAVVLGSITALVFVLVIFGLAARQLMNDRRRAEVEAHRLSDALNRAQSAEQTKMRFLANMSHEMRTPLNGVAGMTEALTRTKLDPTQRELVDAIHFSSSTLDRLISDLISVSRDVVAAADERPAETFNLGAAIRAIALPFGVEAKAKGLAFTAEVDPEANVRVSGDLGGLGELLACLLSNGLKFTERGQLGVSVRRIGEGRFGVEVSDSGIGFDDAMKARLFETFTRSDDSDTRRFGGAGLGLAVARRRAQELGGTLEARSTPGQGSVFSFEIELMVLATDAGGDQRVDGGDDAGAVERVLIVDDNPTNRKVLELILGQLDVDWVSVEDGRQAVAAAAAEPFAAILMDIQMPVMDGLTATREIRQMERAAGRHSVPVIIVSASCQPEHVEAGRQAGAQRHLGKPVSAQALIEALNDVVVEAAQAA